MHTLLHTNFSLRLRLYYFKLSVLLLLFLGWVPFHVFAQCPPGDVTLLTQAEVDQFAVDYPGCTTISGNLTIGPSTNINNLNALSTVTNINQSLTISDNQALLDMSGLSGIVSVYRNIVVINNELLPDVNLENINGAIIGSFLVQNNPELTTLSAPLGLSSIGENLYIDNNPKLENLTGLENLTSVGRLFRIIGTLEDDFPDFSNLISVGTDIAIINNPNVGILNFQNVSGSLGTDFSIQNNTALTSLAAPVNLTNIGGNLYIANNPNLVDLTGLENVTTVGRLFRIGNTLEDNFPDFSKLTSVGTDIVIFSNQNLTSINLQNVSGSLATDFAVVQNAVLTNLAAPENLTSIGNNLEISGNPNLSQITGLENLTSVGLRFYIAHTLEDDFPDFSKLTHVGRLIGIANNANVTYLNFQNVSGSLSQSFQIAGNPSLMRVDAPINLTAVGEDLTFSLNPNLTTVTGLKNINSIGQMLYIDRNGINGPLDFSSVTSIGRVIYIVRNPNITSIDVRNVGGKVGIGASTANGIAIDNNTALTTFAAPQLTTVVDGPISINNNPNLSNFTGFGNLANVTKGLYLSDISASSFPDMLNLSTIGGDLDIIANTQVETLSWLSNLVSIGGALRIQNNPFLSYCTINAVCNFLGGTGGRSIVGNNGCCLNEPILTDACNNVSSGTAEVCDGEDNDCDGLIDEDFDQDQDGFTTCDGDCNDTNAAIFPGAEEICDGFDNDCDGLVDEGFDQDQDGYTTCMGDCDDTNAEVNPDATEICNGIDDNCNDQIDENENEIPEITAIALPVDPVVLGATIEATATFTDADAGNTHTAEWNWGDGAVSAGIITATNEGFGVSGEHDYLAPGVYIVSLTVTDNCLDSDTEISATYAVVYDPGEGFVTGGGWINSPAGAYVDAPELTGKANFGFVSKYLPGQSKPSGNTQFHFNAAGFKFKSTEYDWLTIAGPNAKFKGSGKVNNQGTYGFMLTAIDGQINGGGGIDKFRIKIWDKDDDDRIVYDNKMNADDLGYDTQELGSGSIVIHKNGPGTNRISHTGGVLQSSADFSAFPNPFTREVQLSFNVRKQGPARITIFSAQGILVRTLNLATVDSGLYQVTWDGRGEQSDLLPKGVYIARLDLAEERAFQQLVLMR